MRILFVGTAAIALSGCSWMGGSKHHNGYQYSQQNSYYQGQQAQKSDKCCVNGKRLSRWNLEGAIGPEFFLGGDAITGDTNDIDGVIPNVTSINDAFDEGLRYEVGGSYALNPNRKVTLMGSYAEADGDNVTLGTINGDAVTGQFSDYQRYGVEVGLRQYMTPTPAPVFGSVRPYVEGKIGAAHVDDIILTNVERAGAAYNGGSIRMYEKGWVPTAAGMVGVEAPVFKRATLALETGIRYTGVLESDTRDLGPGAPLAGTNNGMESWTVPVQLRGRFRF